MDPSKLKNSTFNFEIDEEQVNHPCAVSNGFCSFFSNVISQRKRKAFSLPDFIRQNLSKIEKKTEKLFNFQPVTSDEVERCLKGITSS